MVLFWIEETTPDAVNAQFIATYLVAFCIPVTVYELGKVPVSATLLPTMFVVPDPALLEKPIVFPVIV